MITGDTLDGNSHSRHTAQRSACMHGWFNPLSVKDICFLIRFVFVQGENASGHPVWHFPGHVMHQVSVRDNLCLVYICIFILWRRVTLHTRNTPRQAVAGVLHVLHKTERKYISKIFISPHQNIFLTKMSLIARKHKQLTRFHNFRMIC